MARKDVDLVVRAKDEATSVLDSITKALNGFIKAEDKVDAGTGKAVSAFSALGAALQKLDKEFKGVAVSTTLAKQLDTATAAAARLEAEMEATAAAAAKLSTAAQRSGAATDALAKKTAGAAAAQERQTSALTKAKADQEKLGATLRQAVADRDRLVASEGKQAAALVKQSAAVEKATAHYEKLAAKIDATAKPSATLVNQFISANDSLTKQTQKLTGLREAYATTTSGISGFGGKIAGLSADLEKANASVARQESVLAKIKSNFNELGAATKAAADKQKGIQTEIDKTGTVLARQAAELQKAKVDLDLYGAAAGKVNVAMAELAAKSGTALTASFQAQRRAMLETKKEWADSTAKVKALADEISRVGVPTRKMVTDLNAAKVAAAASKGAYNEQRVGLRDLGQVMKTTATDIAGLQAKQNAFASVQDRVAAAVSRARQAAQTSGTAYSTLSGNATRAAQGVTQLDGAVSRVGSNTSKAARSTDELSEAYNRMHGNQRLALTWTQRLRNEIVALVAAYVGVQGVIGILTRTVEATQKLENAQVRLNALYDGDQSKAAKEFDFIRRTANRLGVDIGVLADEYTKFAAATKGTVLQGTETARVFTKIAEAGRVNNLSLQDMQGIFRAVIQIASKGKVQLEELQGQLGDRLPGALQIMADGLGITVQELQALTKEGKVSSDALSKFADNLEKRYGSALPNALRQTSAQIGFFQNAVTSALVAFGKAGFIESFNNLLKDMTETLKSADFEAFAQKASAAFALLIDVVGVAVKNFDLLVIAAAAFGGVKITQAVLAIAAAFTTQLLPALRASKVEIAAVQGTLAASTTAAAGAAVGFGRLAVAFRALLSSTGVGLAITAISIGIGYWATRANDATEALNEHRKMVDQVKDAYETAGGSAKAFADKIKGISASQAQAVLDKLRQNLKDIKDEADSFSVFGNKQSAAWQSGIGFFAPEGAIDQLRSIREMTTEFEAGTLEADKFKEALDKIAQNAATPEIKEYALELQNVADRSKDAAKEVADQEKVVKALTSTQEEGLKVAGELVGKTDDSAAAMERAKQDTASFKEEIDKMNEVIPKMGQNLDRLKAQADLDEAFESAARAAKNMGMLNEAIKQYNINKAKLDQLAPDYEGNYSAERFAGTPAGKNNEALVREVTKLAEQMGLSAKDLLAAMSFETGGKLDPSIMGGKDGKYLGLIQFSPDQQKKFGLDQNSSVEQQVAAAGKYLADAGVKAGDGLTQIYAAILSGSAKNVNASDVKNGGVVSNVSDAVNGPQFAGHIKNAEGLLKAYGGIVEDQKKILEQDKEAAKEAEKKAEKVQEQKDGTKEQIAENQQAIEQQKLINDGKEEQAAIEKAIAEAKKANPNITDAEVEQIRKQTSELYKLQQVKKDAKTDDTAKTREAAAAMAQVNALLSQRTALESQLKAQQTAGNTTGADQTRTAIQNVNTELTTAIAKAKELYQNLGGPAADTAITKLDTVAIKANTLAQSGQKSVVNWGQVADLFAGGVATAFDTFAQNVAAGKSIAESARLAFLQFASDFLRQIAQMIIKQAVLNALQKFSPTLFGTGVSHAGGMVNGVSDRTRQVNPGMFAVAQRFHGGGFPGLAVDEVPIIAQKGEEVLKKTDPRNALNGGLTPPSAEGGGRERDIKVVNMFDAGSFVSEGLNSKSGQRSFLNFVSANKSAIKGALG